MNIFSGLDKLSWGIEASWKRNSVILNNVANVDTPNFKSSDVQFEEIFRKSIDEQDKFVFNKTRPTHFDIGGRTDKVEAVVVQNNNTTQRMDGNNVDIDSEMTKMAKNVIYYNALSRKASGTINQLRTAIKEGR